MVLTLIVSVILACLIGALEMAISALDATSETQVKEHIEEGLKGALRVMDYIDHPKPYQQTVVIVNLVLYGVIAVIIDATFYPWFFGLFNTNLWVLSIVSHILIFFVWFTIVVVLSTLIARRIGYKYKEKIAYTLMPIISFIKIIFIPLVLLYDGLSKALGHVFGLQNAEGEREVTEEQIRNIVEESSKTGNIEEAESEMIQNIFDFTDTTVDEIMTHRTEISAININSTKEEVMTYIKDEQYTRFPVFEKDIDHIVGTFHVKDILKILDEDTFSLKSFLRKPYFIPDSKKTAELFAEMQKEKNHIAIVLDEYGGTAGIVTIEDLIEEIVGNIFDEYDIVEDEVQIIDNRTFEVNGLISIDDAEDAIEADLPVDDYDTLSGFILGQLGRFPEPDEKVEFEYHGFTFTVLSVDENVITKVQVVKPDLMTTEDED